MMEDRERLTLHINSCILIDNNNTGFAFNHKLWCDKIFFYFYSIIF